MKPIAREILALSLALLVMMFAAQTVWAQDFIVGADVSSLRAVYENGGSFTDSSESEGALQILQEHGFNWTRAKLWHTPYTELTADPDAEKPADKYNNLEDVIQTAVDSKAQGLKFLLDFHYSDTWADPGRQYKPEAWANITDINVLTDSLYNYTYAVMNRLKIAGALPDMVQLGNEIRQGMLWPQGNIYSASGGWDNLGQLLRAGVQAIRDVEEEGDTVLIMIHVDNGSTSFYQNVLNQGVHVDAWGYSYYPQWRGGLDNLQAALEALDAQFPNQKVIIAETAYIWTTEYPNNDSKPDVLNWNPQWVKEGEYVNTLDGYPTSPEGQRLFLMKLRNMMQNLPNNRGWGIFYWEPAWIPDPTYGSPMDNATLFDWDGNAMISIDGLATDTTYPPPPPSTMMTLRFNTTLCRDTLQPNDQLQLRADVKGVTGDYLEDGRKISWGDDSRLLATNVGGDYWEITIPLPIGDTLAYKLWTGHTLWDGTYPGLGNEGIVTADLDGEVKTRLAISVDHDTTYPLEYLNGTLESVSQYWRPWNDDEDSLAVVYRVNMAQMVASGQFNPDSGDLVGVYGNAPLPDNSISLMLEREEFTVADGSFWSGHMTLARTELESGLNHQYRFVIFPAGESPIEEDQVRTVSLTSSITELDTTLHWVYFNDGHTLSAPEQQQPGPERFSLVSVYPNPFNSDVRITFSLNAPGRVDLAVYNLLGRQVATLVSERLNAGMHEAVWTGRSSAGKPVPSGAYILRLSDGTSSQQRKITLVR